MFTESANWYDAFHAPKDYAGEARGLASLVRGIHPGASSLLDVACGTGRHLEYFSEIFHCHGIDLDPNFIEIARQRLPGMNLETGDMVSFTTEMRFDIIVCLYYGIGYARTTARLRAAVECMAACLNHSGILIIEPWILREEWKDNSAYSDSAAVDGRIVRRAYRARRTGSLVDMEISYRWSGETRQEIHELGLFTLREYMAAIAGSGLRGCWLPRNPSGRRLAIGVSPALEAVGPWYQSLADDEELL